ncbi:MAG: carbon-nitrogen hydrolase family protein [Planctomycetota bacterium]|nr:carbon-nitrogen hydrolase family protein [Planctomycetota bacterium]
MPLLRVATCQFSTEPEIDKNRKSVLKLMREAADHKAHVSHFPEAGLSGYAGVDIPATKGIDWDELVAATKEIQAEAKKLKQWVLLGSTHRLTEPHKPHNSIYVIDDKGKIVNRYDKRFCTGVCRPKSTLDMQHYSPGDRFVTFKIRGVKCGVLICYDYRFPELYREYKKLGVDVIFQSFHNARKSVVRDGSYNIWRTIVPATMACRAAENHFWISATNSTARPSMWGSFAVRPDGHILGQLPLHRTAVLMTEMNVGGTYFDAAGPWRDRAMKGELHSGELVSDPRSSNVTAL